MGAMDLVFKLIFGSKEQNDAKILKPIAEKTLTFEEFVSLYNANELKAEGASAITVSR